MSAPFLWIFVCFVAGVLSGSSLNIEMPFVIALFTITAVTIGFSRHRIALSVLLLLFFVIGNSAWKMRFDAYDSELRQWVQLHPRYPVRIEGVVTRTPEIYDDYVVLRMRVLTVSGKPALGIARLTVAGRIADCPARGDMLEVVGALRLPENFRTEGAFDYEGFLFKENVHVLGSVKNAHLLRIKSRSASFASMVSKLRMRLVRQIQEGFEGEQSAVLKALWLDDRTGLNQELQQRLIDSGVFHIVAISGFHIAVLLAILFWLLKPFATYRVALIVVLVVACFYGVLLEGRASVTRAILSFLVLVFARLMKDRVQLVNAFFLTAFLQLLVNPLEFYDVGFHLTYLATAAILFLVLPLSRFYENWPTLYKQITTVILCSAVIEIVLLPYQALVFHRLSLGSVGANLLAVPLSSVLIASGIAVIPFAKAVLLKSAIGGLLKGFFLWIGFFSETSLYWIRPPLGLVICFYLALVILMICKPRKRKWTGGLGAFVLFILLMIPKEGDSEKEFLRFHFLDVGQGDAIVLEYPDGTYDIVDGGGFWNPDSLDTGEAILIPYLAQLGVKRVNRVFLTHAHADHMNGLRSIIKYLPVSEVVITRRPVGDSNFRRFLSAIQRTPATFRSGKAFRQGPVRIDVLAPPDNSYTSRVTNSDSLVLRLEYASKAVLLMGDSERPTEVALPESALAGVRYLKVAHHGSKTSTSDEFLNGLHLRGAFISAGRQNLFGHPHPLILDRLRSRHIQTYRTDTLGTIRLTITEGYDSIDYYGS